jgi:hypothetical protein
MEVKSAATNRGRLAALLALLLVLFISPSPAAAQEVTQQKLDRAVQLYADLNVEAARPILLEILSPTYQQKFTTEQKVTALKYLGASYAVLDKADSAVTFFLAALDYDPFTDLDPSKFTATELAAFGQAKARIFKIAIKGITPKVVDPKADSTAYPFRFITTHSGHLTVELINQRDTTRREILFDGTNEGLREIRWTGIMNNGQLADSALYELRAIGRDATSQVPTTDRQMFRVEYAFQPLEDTLRAFTQTDLLQERIPSSAPWLDLAKGSFVAAASIAFPMLALDRAQVSWAPHAASAVALGLTGGIASFVYRRSHPEIVTNVRENARRQAERARFNAAVKIRNKQRTDATKLVIWPLTGVGR